MPSSEARIRVNRANALKSTGPRTPERKERSRADAYKHGLTGEGVVLPEREAAEVERRVKVFHEELRPSGEVGQALVRHAATMSVRMERCVAVENATLTERVRRSIADFVPPEGADSAEAARLRSEAGTRAMFDPSKDATLARRYEAAATRSFFWALLELRRLERAAQAVQDDATRELLASFSGMDEQHAEFDALYPDPASPVPRLPVGRPELADRLAPDGRGEVPVSIGRRR